MADEKMYNVIGYVVYSCIETNDTWIEYRMLSQSNEETWLSIDEKNQEYSLSWPSYIKDGQIGPEWHKVDEGTQIVIEYAGDVDVDPGETGEFIEHEDDTEEKILSVEIWEEGSEISEGFYLDEDEITGLGVNGTQGSGCKGCLGMVLFFALFLVVFSLASGFLDRSMSAYNYFKSSPTYVYVTSITGSEKQKAHIFESIANENSFQIREVKNLEREMENANELNAKYKKKEISDPMIDYLVKDLLVHTNLNIEYITENKETKDSVAVLTKQEYCLFYHPEGEPHKIYVQVSDRKFNYSSNIKPYLASMALNSWYRSNYYSSAYSYDASRWSSIPSSYDMYDGPIVKDLGNGYYDVYSNDVKQSSVRHRESMGGGHSAGK